MCQAFQSNWVQKITAFAETQPLAANIIASMKEAVADNPTPQKGNVLIILQWLGFEVQSCTL